MACNRTFNFYLAIDLWKLTNIFYYCDYVTIYLLNTIVSWLANRKIIDLYLTKVGSNRKTCNHFLKSRCILELPWNFFKNTNAQVLLFSKASDDTNEQSCLKTTGLYDNLLLLSSLFQFFYFTFSALISFSLCSQFLHLFFHVLSPAFIKCSRKAFVYI